MWRWLGGLSAGLGVALAFAIGSGGGGGQQPRPMRLQAALDYARLPMAFERNVGQADPQAQYVARGAGYALLLTAHEPRLALQHGRGPARWLGLGLAGASPQMRLEAGTRAPGTVNYIEGSNPAGWHTGVPTYARVRYADAYPGIDVAFHGTNRSLEFDFELAPGADPAHIALAPSGQAGMRIDRSGGLVLALPGGGAVREARPRSHQVIDGRLRSVSSRFEQRPDGTIGIAVNRYDPRRALTIDPVLTYSTYLGGAEFDIGNGIAIDSTGAAYVAGTTASTAFPTTAGAQQTTFGGVQDAFVTKISPGGTSVAYSTYLGGSGVDIANGVAVDANGAAYVAGTTSSSNFPTTAGAFQTTLGGPTNAFVAKLAPSGTSLSWSTFLGGSGSDTGTGIATDGTGAAYLTGSAGSANFPTTAGAFQTVAGGGGADAYATKVAANGASLAYSTLLGGTGSDSGAGIAVAASGAAYVTGRTASSGFPTTPGAPQATLRGATDAFVTKVGAAGASLAWSTLLGGGDSDQGLAIAVDGAGDAFVTGSTPSTDFPVTAGAAQAGYGGGSTDAFAAEVDAGGGSFTYATLLGGQAADSGRGVAVDPSGGAFVVGQTASTNFPVTSGAAQSTYAGGSTNGFVTRIAPDGHSRTFSTFLGGSGGAATFGVAVDGAGAAYVTGSTSSSNFPVTAGAAQGASGGSADAYVAKLVPPAGGTTTTTTTTTTTATTTTGPPPNPPTIVPGTVHVTWNRVSVPYRLIDGVAILLNVTAPGGHVYSADLRNGVPRGTLVWNRMLGSRIAPPGRYSLVLLASSQSGDVSAKNLSATLRLLYAHPPRIANHAAHVRYELTAPATVTLRISPPKGGAVTVVRTHGRRGHNTLTWNLKLHGERVAGGTYHLTVTARTASGTTARVVLP